jgi:hypothetical protein
MRDRCLMPAAAALRRRRRRLRRCHVPPGNTLENLHAPIRVAAAVGQAQIAICHPQRCHRGIFAIALSLRSPTDCSVVWHKSL